MRAQVFELKKIDSILRDKNLNNDIQTIVRILNLSRYTPWRRTSNVTSQITSYPDLLIHDSLVYTIDHYSRIMSIEFDGYKTWNETLDKAAKIIGMDYDLRDLTSASASDQKFPLPEKLFVRRLKNYNYELSEITSGLISADSLNASKLSKFKNELNMKLKGHKVILE